MKASFSFFVTMLLCMVSGRSQSQGFSGVAIYQYDNQVKFHMDSTNMSPEQMQQTREQIRRQMRKEFSLTFNATESSWKQLESLDNPSAVPSGGHRVLIKDGPQNVVLYKNLAEGRFERGEEVMGKPFIIKDTLETYHWELTEETRQIGSFQCQKAVYQRIVNARVFGARMDEMEVTKDTIETVAWFTQEIPVGHGPAMTHGLPGLILELNSGGRTYLCTRVVLNPAAGVSIEIPGKGKEISEATYMKMQEEQAENMMQRYNGAGEGNRIEIKIGG